MSALDSAFYTGNKEDCCLLTQFSPLEFYQLLDESITAFIDEEGAERRKQIVRTERLAWFTFGP